MDINDSNALPRNIRAFTANNLSITIRESLRGPRCPIDSTVMHTPIIVADAGKMCAESPLELLSFRLSVGDGGVVLDFDISISHFDRRTGLFPSLLKLI